MSTFRGNGAIQSGTVFHLHLGKKCTKDESSGTARVQQDRGHTPGTQHPKRANFWAGQGRHVHVCTISKSSPLQDCGCTESPLSIHSIRRRLPASTLCYESLETARGVKFSHGKKKRRQGRWEWSEASHNCDEHGSCTFQVAQGDDERERTRVSRGFSLPFLFASPKFFSILRP